MSVIPVSRSPELAEGEAEQSRADGGAQANPLAKVLGSIRALLPAPKVTEFTIPPVLTESSETVH